MLLIMYRSLLITARLLAITARLLVITARLLLITELHKVTGYEKVAHVTPVSMHMLRQFLSQFKEFTACYTYERYL